MVIGLVLSILESNHIPVVSMFSSFAGVTAQTEDNKAEDPVKESETVKIESAKDYLHEVYNFSFVEPVLVMVINHPVMFKAKFPYTFYPDVPTPPPNC